MGKRELLIAAAFLVAGIAAYWLTAGPVDRPVAKDSLPALVDEWRQEAARSAARETVQSIGTERLERQVSEVRIAGFTRVHVTGEERGDVAWTLSTEASGPTPEAARETARQTVVGADLVGDALALAPRAPEEARQTTDIQVRVPTGTAVRLENSRRVTVERAGRVRLESLVGDVTLSDLTGPVTGSHRNGALDVRGAAGVTLNLNGTRATFAGVTGDLTVTARNGEIRVASPSGTTSVDSNNVTLTIDEPSGAVRTNVSGGALALTSPRGDVHVDTRNSRTDLTLDRAVPITLVGTSATLVVSLVGTPLVEIDAAITDGQIDASTLGLSPERAGDGARLLHAYGTSARVTLRSTRGEIVIARRK